MTSKHGDKAGTSDWFEVTNSVKQEFVLVPTLFSLFMSAMLEEVFNGKKDGTFSPEKMLILQCDTRQGENEVNTIAIKKLLFANGNELVDNHTRKKINL